VGEIVAASRRSMQLRRHRPDLLVDDGAVGAMKKVSGTPATP
jgi:hypothetical protein